MLDIATKQEDNTIVVLLNGKLDVNAAAEADKRFTQIGQDAESVVIDCADLTYISSAGLRAFQRLRQTLKNPQACEAGGHGCSGCHGAGCQSHD